MTSKAKEATVLTSKPVLIPRQKEPPDRTYEGFLPDAGKEGNQIESVKVNEAEIRKLQTSKGKVKISELDLTKARKGSNLTLYGKFFGRSSPFELVKSILPKIWIIKAKCNVIDLPTEFYAFKFDNEEDYWDVLSGGPWFLKGQALSLLQWKDNFQPPNEKVEEISVWVQFLGLPYEYLSSNILPQVAAVIGKPLKGFWIDTERGSFFQSVAYENILMICFKCGLIGHFEVACRAETSGKNVGDKEAVPSAKDGEMENEKLLGPWVQVQRRKRGGQSQFSKKPINENSFKVLENPAFEAKLKNDENGGEGIKYIPVEGNKKVIKMDVVKQNSFENKGKISLSAKNEKEGDGNGLSNRTEGKIALKQLKCQMKEVSMPMNLDKGTLDRKNSSSSEMVDSFMFEAESRKEDYVVGKNKKENEQKNMDVLAEKLFESFKKILDNENAEEDFMEFGINPEFSRIRKKEAKKFRRWSAADENLFSVPVEYKGIRNKKKGKMP
ncbi:hypothetical protein Cni_G14397 [Canna indica]|uniref:DUF4283 domain-containing protein n=1 Tax=Canna indica TaxID=4628 RepID=A0AAQ3QDZ1_9LILI|nr:hypothetical protein Cni_G14397 [Canna indica]